MKPFRIHTKLTIRDSNPLVREHRVHDIHILPGVSLLDATYKTLAAAKLPADSVVVHDLLFHEPVVTSEETDRCLTVRMDMNTEMGRVTITSIPSCNGEELPVAPTLHMTCTVKRVDTLGLEHLPVNFEAQMGETVDLDCCYGVTRHIGISHDSFMKCIGSVASVSGGNCAAAIQLSEAAAARMSDFMLHPVFLDCATIVPLFNWRDRLDETSLFIPFAIEEFCARPFYGLRHLRVLGEPNDSPHADQEILRYTSTLYECDGRAVARIKNFGVKRVRSLDAIYRAIDGNMRTRSRTRASKANNASKPQLTLSVSPAAVFSQHLTDSSPMQELDAVLTLIGSLIVQYGKASWTSTHVQTRFFDLGLDSLVLLEMSEKLEKELNVRLYPTLLFEYPTAAQLTKYLREFFPKEIALFEEKQKANLYPNSRESVSLCEQPPSVANDDTENPQILIPRWFPERRTDSGVELADHAVVLLGVAPLEGLIKAIATRLSHRCVYQASASQADALVRDFKDALDHGLECDAVWLIGVDHNIAFEVVRALRDARRLDAALSLKAITFNAFNIHNEISDANAGHGIWGLWQSVSREYANVKVSLIDLDHAEYSTAFASDGDWFRYFLQGTNEARELRAVRAGRAYGRSLYGVTKEKYSTSKFRHGGVYMIIGGSGGVGMEFAAYLRRQYGAKVVISGRSTLDPQLRGRLSAIGEYGEEVFYVQASVDNETALVEGIEQVQKKFKGLDGIIHSAMVLEDKRLADMSVEDFNKVLRPKVDGIRALARATAKVRLDFLLVFSSMQSFIGNIAQANYATASTFLDGFAASMRTDRPYPVIVINWGFWSEVGAVATDVYRNLLRRQGLFGMRSSEALATLEHVLSAGYEQALIIAADKQVLQQMCFQQDILISRQEPDGELLGVPSSIDIQREPTWKSIFVNTDQGMQTLLGAARCRISQVLRDLGIYGRGAITVDQAVNLGNLSSQYAALAHALLRYLRNNNVLEGMGLDAPSFSDTLLKLATAQPLLSHFIPLLHASVAAYPEILTGKQSPTDILFPNGSSELVRAVYGTNDISRFYNNVVASAVLALASKQTRKPVRILEIGAGTGATSVEVLCVLKEAGIDCEYCYTDLWDKLVTEGRNVLGPAHPNMRFQFLDISIEPARQGFAETFDIVIATNVLHATRDLRIGLRHAKHLLRKGGVLVLNESVVDQEYSAYTFGLLPGWWNALDKVERLPTSPLATVATWTALLKEEAFLDVCSLIREDQTIPSVNSQQIFIARSDGETRHSVPQPITSGYALPERQLPHALMGKLRPYVLRDTDGLRVGQPRHLDLFCDERDNFWLFLNHPPANTFTNELLEELCSVLLHLSKDGATALHKRLLYISHYGKYFSLGGDRTEILENLEAANSGAVYAFAEKARELLQLLASLDTIVIAVVDGTAQGGGLETIMAADLQLVREGVRLGLPEIKSGLIPGMGGLTYLQKQIGAASTKRLVLLGELIEARVAYDLGIISHVVEEPFLAALALPDQLVHLETARVMKRILARQTGAHHVTDIDDWLTYVTQYKDSIDTQRIAASAMLLEARSIRRGI